MTRRPGARPLIVRLVLGVTYSVVVAAVLLEIFLRVFDPIGIRYYFDTARYFKAMQPSDAYAYLHTPGYEAELQGVDIRINREGLRGPQFEVDKGVRKRLLILGDSVVFGWGAPQDAIFPALLQRMTEADGLGYEVISAGAGSWNTRTEYEFFRERVLNYDPDVVLLLIVPNDVEPKAAGRTFVARDELTDTRSLRVTFSNRVLRAAAKYSYLVATLRHIFQRRSAAGRLVAMYEPNSPQWRDTDNALENMASQCRSRGIELVVFLYADLQSDFSRAFHAAYSSSLERLGVPYHVLAGNLFAPEYRNSIVDGHPNAEGHRLIAEAMYTGLRPHL